jgi:hypothetical protein
MRIEIYLRTSSVLVFHVAGAGLLRGTLSFDRFSRPRRFLAVDSACGVLCRRKATLNDSSIALRKPPSGSLRN